MRASVRLKNAPGFVKQRIRSPDTLFSTPPVWASIIFVFYFSRILLYDGLIMGIE